MTFFCAAFLFRDAVGELELLEYKPEEIQRIAGRDPLGGRGEGVFSWVVPGKYTDDERNAGVI
jgi:hypothetical protein